MAWGGPNSKKGRGNKGKGSRKVARTSGVGEAGDEESYVEGSEEVEPLPRKITYQRKRRNASEGDYGTKPPPEDRPTLNFLKTGKGYVSIVYLRGS